MIVKEYFINLFEYEYWANNKVLMYIENNTRSRCVINLFSHMVADMKPWITLLSKETVPGNIECLPSWNVQQCKDELNEVNTKISRIINSLNPAEMKNKVSSLGSNGQFFVNTVTEVLTQIASHSQYHRGQIEMLIKDETGINLRTMYMSYLRNKDKSQSAVRIY